MSYTDQEFTKIVSTSLSKSEICRKIGLPKNGTGLRHVTKRIDELKLDISHFSTPQDRGVKLRKYQHIKKDCPVCGTKFDAIVGSKREKQTCSYACSNTLFRSGNNNGQHRHGGYTNLNKVDGSNGDSEYRVICFKKHERKCIVCGWDISVDVHHLDENHSNNDPNNLVPLCPNHHRMIHLKEYKEQLIEQIKEILPGVPHSCL